jgi:predicted nuclease of predicted toxin-antitoxin system
MRFFLDEGVPHGVGRLLEEEGFEVLYLEDKIAKGSKDTLVAAISEANDAVLIAFDSDFKAIARRTGIGQRRFRKLSLLRFEKCRESVAPNRLRQALSLVKHEWSIGNGDRDRRMFIVITGTSIRTHR